MESVIKDIIEHEGFDEEILVLLQATSPLRLDEDVERVILCHEQGGGDLVMTVTLADVGILKYGMLRDGKFLPISRPEFCFTNRQSLPPVYRPNGAVYAFTAAAFRSNGGFPRQRIAAVEMPAERSRDIDTLEDFAAVCQTLRQRGRPIHQSRPERPIRKAS